MKNTFTRKNLIAMLLVMLVAMTTIFMTGCDKEENVATVDSVATVDETETSTQATEYNTAASETTSSATTSTAAAETTVGENNRANTSINNGSDNKPADRVIVTEGNTSPQHTHSYGKVVNKATCTKDGCTVYSCACGAKYTSDYVEAYGHKWSSWKTVKEATTESEGKRERTCGICGKVKSEAIEKILGSYDVPAVDNVDLLCERILYYINSYRSVDGYSLPNMQRYAMKRAEQASVNFAHDENDKLVAATELKYGEHIYKEETIYDWDTDTIINTGKFLDYYVPHVQEALGKVLLYNASVDELAKEIADQFYHSSGHWAYIGDSSHSNISVGVYFVGAKAYTCVVVSEDATIYG